MKQDFWINVFFMSFMLVITTSLALVLVSGCNEPLEFVCKSNLTCPDAGTVTAKNTSTQPANAQNAANKNNVNNNSPDGSIDAGIPQQQAQGEPDAGEPMPLAGIRLTCENDRNRPMKFMTLYGTLNAQPIPLTQWERGAHGCAAYFITRPSGHNYHLTMIPVPNNIFSVDEWLKDATIGNISPPVETISFHVSDHANIYIATDLGMPKVYAMVLHAGYMLYVEMIVDENSDPQQQLRNLVESHMTLDIPQDLRNLLEDMS